MAALTKAARAAGGGSGGGAAQSYQQQARAAQQAAQAAQRLATEQQKTAREAANAATANQRLASEQQRTAQTAAQAAAANQRLATEEAKTAQAAQRLATEQAKTAQAVANAAAAKSRAEQQALRLAQAQDRAAQSGGALGRVLGEVGSIAAGAFSIGALAAFAKDAIDAANNLEDVQSSLRAVAGDQATYDKAVRAAQDAQRLFGGSMADNINELQGFILTSRTAGVAFEDLIMLARQLATLDPGQGLRGASVAIRELASGNIASLAMRFELPRETLRQLTADGATTASRIQALSQYLADVGITSDTVTGKLDNTSQSFRDLASAGDAVQTAVGAALANALAPFADKLAMVGQFVAQQTGQWNNFNQGVSQLATTAMTGAASYEEYAERIRYVKDELAAAGFAKTASEVAVLTRAQYDFAQGLIASGVAAADAYGLVDGMSVAQQRYAEGLMAGGMAAGDAAAKAREYGSAIDAVNGVQGQLFSDAGASSDQLAELGDRMLAVAMASDEGRTQIEQLAAEYRNGSRTSNELEDAVFALESAQLQAAQAAQEEADAQRLAAEEAATKEANSRALADSLMLQAQATDDSTLAAQAQKAALETAAQAAQDAANDGKTLKDQALAAASALLAAGSAGAAAASQLAGSSVGVNVLTAAYYRLEAARRAAGGVGAASALGNIGVPRSGGKGTPAAPTSAKGIAAELTAGQQGAFKPPSGGRGGGGGGGGGANEAQQAQQRLADIAADGAARIEEINAQAAERLVEIDRRMAEERARIATELQRSLSTDAARGAADREANDLDLVGETDKKRLAQLQAREKAEAEAAARLVELQQQTRDMIAAGEVEAAEAQYEAGKQAIEERQRLDEQYYQRQAELAGNPEALAELDKQYQEAVKAQEDAAKLEQEIAAAKAQEKIQKAEDEKLAVIQAAEDQKTEVVKRAQDQAAGVKGAADAQRQAVVTALSDQATAATNWADATEKAAARVASAYQKAADAASKLPSAPAGGSDSGSSAGGGTKAAGGGTFVTGGPTTLTVGDNPGGVELVTVTPLSGKGSTSVGPGMARMAGGGALLAGGAPGLSPEAAQQLVAEARRALELLEGQLVPLSEEQADALGRVLDVTSAAIGILSDMAALRTQAMEPALPVDSAVMYTLADEARRASDLLQRMLVPLTEEAAAELQRYADVAGAAVGILGAVTDLRRQAMEPAFPVDSAVMYTLADEARRAVTLLERTIVPVTQDGASAAERYASAAGSAIDVLGGAADLRARLGEPAPPLDEAYVKRLAGEAQRVARIVNTALVPTTEEQAQALSQYASAVGSSVSAVADAAILSADLFDAYRPPSDAQIQQVATDAQRVVKAFHEAAGVMDGDGLDAAERYASATAATMAAVREGLLSIRAINDEAFVLDDSRLVAFEESTTKLIATTKRLGAAALSVPAGSVAALRGTAEAVTAVAGAYTALASVPYGNLPELTAGYAAMGGGGGGGSTTSVSVGQVVVQAQPGQDVRAIADAVIARLGSLTGGRRS